MVEVYGGIGARKLQEDGVLRFIPRCGSRATFRAPPSMRPQTSSTAKRREGETNSSCAATVRISRDPASSVRRSKPKIDAAASPTAAAAERVRR